jgi:hypothetical protein
MDSRTIVRCLDVLPNALGFTSASHFLQRWRMSFVVGRTTTCVWSEVIAPQFLWVTMALVEPSGDRTSQATSSLQVAQPT